MSSKTSIQMIDKLLTKGLKKEKVKVKPKAGRGSGCVEAPRGILFHTYEFDKKGDCMAADMCIPTNQNHANIQKDFEKFVPEIMDEGKMPCGRKWKCSFARTTRAFPARRTSQCEICKINEKKISLFWGLAIR